MKKASGFLFQKALSVRLPDHSDSAGEPWVVSVSMESGNQYVLSLRVIGLSSLVQQKQLCFLCNHSSNLPDRKRHWSTCPVFPPYNTAPSNPGWSGSQVPDADRGIQNHKLRSGLALRNPISWQVPEWRYFPF